MAPLCPFDPFLSPDPYPAPTPARSFSPTLLCSDLYFPEIVGYLFRFGNGVGCAFQCEKETTPWGG